MTNSVLVAYATRNGSTQEVAEVIADTLGHCRLDADLQPLRSVRDLSKYSAVVMGAPLYMFRWHKDALQFLTRHREALTRLPVAVFALGPMQSPPNPDELQEVNRQIHKELAKFPWLSPVAIEIIGGKFDPTMLRFPLNLIPALKMMPASDLRDWNAIRGWASSLADKFQPA